MSRANPRNLRERFHLVPCPAWNSQPPRLAAGFVHTLGFAHPVGHCPIGRPAAASSGGARNAGRVSIFECPIERVSAHFGCLGKERKRPGSSFGSGDARRTAPPPELLKDSLVLIAINVNSPQVPARGTTGPRARSVMKSEFFLGSGFFSGSVLSARLADSEKFIG